MVLPSGAAGRIAVDAMGGDLGPSEVVAAVTAAACVRFLVHWLTRHGLAVFAWYRIGLALALAAVFCL